MSCNIDAPTDRSVIAVNTLTTSNKVIFLPAAASVPGRYITLKDYYGNSASSSFTVSTTSNNRIDRFNSSILISTSFQCLTLLSDGISNWATVANEVGPIPTAFLPTQISTPEIWFDASFLPNITYNSSNFVTSWSNRGSRAVAAVSNATQTPPRVLQRTQNGLNLLSYQNSNLLTIPSMVFATAERTLFTVFKQNSNLVSGQAINFLQANNGYNFADFTFYCGFNNASSNIVGTINGGYCLPVYALPLATTTVFQMFSLRATFTATGQQGVWLNGTLIDSNFYCASESGGDSVPFSVGGGTQDKSPNYELAEFMIFQYLMSDADKQRIEGYLAWKWGLRQLLAANHPYKNAPP